MKDFVKGLSFGVWLGFCSSLVTFVVVEANLKGETLILVLPATLVFVIFIAVIGNSEGKPK